tara:strand:+ start:1608 stop:3293 length:1686 start_codon:yes stop_codon:yes gene_type:complete
MGEDQILQIAKQFLNTSQGKSLLDSSLNISDITNRIQELSSKYNIDLPTLETSSLEDINLSIGSNLTQEQRRENRRQKRLTAKERLQERLDVAGITKVDAEQKVRAEISLLRSKLKSQIPILQEYTITGRLQDKNTNTPMQGAKVTLGVNTDVLIDKNTSTNPLGVNENLIPKNTSVNLNDLVFIPVPGQSDRTDKQGNFSIKVKVPIIPENQRTPLVFGLLYSKSGYLPETQAIINGDKTIKTSLPLSSMVNISESAKTISQGFSDSIDLAQSAVGALAMGIFDRIISAKKFSIGKIVDVIKTKLIPLVITLLLSFGISKLSQKNRKTCPSPDALRDVIRTRNRVVRQLNQMFKMIVINSALAFAFRSLAQILKGVRLAMDGLSIPQAIGVIPAKDFGGLIAAAPYSMTAKLQHINDELEKLEEKSEGISKATLVSLVFVIAGTATVILLLKSIDQMTQECAEENGVTDLELTAINQELLDLSEEEAEDGNPIIGNVNGFIFSVETDNANPVGTLKRRFAVAKDSRGITLLRGEPSFSSSDQILIDELIFYIQQNDLKAN